MRSRNERLYAELGYLLQRLQAGAQAGFIPASGVLVQHALLDSFVEGGNRLAESLLRGSLVALREGFTHVAQCGTQTRGVAAVPGGACLGLTGALERRKMVCHGP